MNKVEYSVLEQAERELRTQFSDTGIEFFRKGDGIDKPIYLVVSIPGITKEPDEMISITGNLLAAGKAAKEFKYIGNYSLTKKLSFIANVDMILRQRVIR